MQIFLDCDGVLANFDKHFQELSGEPAHGYEDKNGSKAFWKVVMSDPDFFANLELMPGAQQLVDFTSRYNPIILTGCPQGSWSQPQKQYWRHKHFPKTPMITCESKNKFKYMIPGTLNIIIDDWDKYKTIWEENGGTFIHHKTAQGSIKELREILEEYYGG